MRKNVLAAMLDRARGACGEECCGLLAGRHGVIARILPAKNAAKRPESEYEIAPEELFRLMREIRGAGLELLGIYHSHPEGENAPSARDIERAFYPEAAYFIVSAREDAERPVRAFAIGGDGFAELEVCAE